MIPELDYLKPLRSRKCTFKKTCHNMSAKVTIREEQAGAELCQAHFKLVLAKPALTDVDVVFPVFTKKVVVFFHLPNNLGCRPLVKN